MATLAEYEAMPIEEFGAALLRGMGWKDGDPIGKRKGQQAAKPRLLERRPALLGIGAKEEAAVGVELGAWGKGAKGGRRDQPYTPVILKNAKTGEQLTEEELKAKLEQQKMVESTEAVQKRNLSERDSDRREKRRRTAGTNGDTIVDGTTETIGVVIRTIATMTNAVPLIVATAILTGITNLVVTGDDGRKHASPAWYIAGDLF
ncbi:DNA primase large subunit Spp2 [Cryomyces antarcticus]|nr:DNA primase large subunit Spp2 [Cryomyces antarcticus]